MSRGRAAIAAILDAARRRGDGGLLETEGLALLETGDVDGSIRELLAGIKLAPESPGLYYTLARAYQRAGRLDDAEKARAEFTRLEKLSRTQRTGAQSVGGR